MPTSKVPLCCACCLGAIFFYISVRNCKINKELNNFLTFLGWLRQVKTPGHLVKKVIEFLSAVYTFIISQNDIALFKSHSTTTQNSCVCCITNSVTIITDNSSSQKESKCFVMYVPSLKHCFQYMLRKIYSSQEFTTVWLQLPVWFV